MKTFKYKFYIRTKQKQEFATASKIIEATNLEDADRQLLKLDLPFHTFSTVQIINK